MITLHAWYNEGFVPNAEVLLKAHSSSGDYHGEMNHKIMVRWLEDKLIPNLPPKCVLVVDNAAYHNAPVDLSWQRRNTWYKSGWPGTVSNGPLAC